MLRLERFGNLLCGDRAEQAAALAGLGAYQHLDRHQLFRGFARGLLIQLDAARLGGVRLLHQVDAVRGRQFRQPAGQQEIAAIALADLDQLALFALALDVCL